MTKTQQSTPPQLSKPRLFARKFFSFILLVSILCLIWIVLCFLNQGLEIQPTILLFIFFVLALVVFIFAQHQRYRRVLAFLQRQLPWLTAHRLLNLCLILALILGVIARVSFLVFDGRYGAASDPLSDEGVHWYYAQSLVNGNEIQASEGLYEAFFPHLMTYTATLAEFMSIFGANYSAVIFSNLIFDLIATLAIYLLLRSWRSSRAAKIGAILWLLNPLEILFCAVSVSIVVVNMFVALSLVLVFFVLRALRQTQWPLLIFGSLALGLCISLGNGFRPIFTIFVIAAFLTMLYLILRHGYRYLLPALASLCFIFITIFGGNQLINLTHQSINPYAVSGDVGVGWNFLIGSDYQTRGHWSPDYPGLLGSKLYGEDGSTPTADLEAIQSEFFQMSIDRYRAMGPAKIFVHLVNKSERLFADDTELVTWVLTSALQLSPTNHFHLAMHSLSVLLLVFCLLVTIFYLIIAYRSPAQRDHFLLFLCLGFCGLLAVCLMVEVMRRYIMPLVPILTILTACGLATYLRRHSTRTALSFRRTPQL